MHKNPKILNTDRSLHGLVLLCGMQDESCEGRSYLKPVQSDTPERLELLRAAINNGVAQASGEEYDISKWTFALDLHSHAVQCGHEVKQTANPPAWEQNQLERLNWFSPQVSSTLFVIMAVSWFLGWWYLVK